MCPPRHFLSTTQTAINKPDITTTNPSISEGLGTWSKTGHAMRAAKPGANAGNTAARLAPKMDTILA